MIEVRDGHKNRTLPSALAYTGGERPLHWGEMICWLASFVIHQILTCRSRRILFPTERSGYVIENKEPLLKTWGRSGNLYENKGA
jgi:hypothetical protein